MHRDRDADCLREDPHRSAQWGIPWIVKTGNARPFSTHNILKGVDWLVAKRAAEVLMPHDAAKQDHDWVRRFTPAGFFDGNVMAQFCEKVTPSAERGASHKNLDIGTYRSKSTPQLRIKL